MNRILLLVADWVGRGVALRLSTLRRPKAAEILALRERIDRLRAENVILRSRLLKARTTLPTQEEDLLGQFGCGPIPSSKWDHRPHPIVAGTAPGAEVPLLPANELVVMA